MDKIKRRIIIPNKIYKHFDGRLYYVIDIVVDETSDDKSILKHMVYYRSLYNDKTYVRELNDFISEVDHEKYPDVKQKYKFEEFHGR